MVKQLFWIYNFLPIGIQWAREIKQPNRECFHVELYLLRHGQSQGNVLNIAGLDPPLTEIGQQQIQDASQRLTTIGITRLYCSSLFRAIQTAGILHRHLSIEPSIDPVFCEIWGDNWRGRTRKELAPDFPWAN